VAHRNLLSQIEPERARFDLIRAQVTSKDRTGNHELGKHIQAVATEIGYAGAMSESIETRLMRLWFNIFPAYRVRAPGWCTSLGTGRNSA